VTTQPIPPRREKVRTTIEMTEGIRPRPIRSKVPDIGLNRKVSMIDRAIGIKTV
jgi:hypothetical protein